MKLAIIGGSYLQLPLVNKAKDMGIETHCFSWREGAICANIADFFYPISVIEKDLILEECKKIGINGIVTIASDVSAPTVAYIAEKLGLVGNSYRCSIMANNKYLMRQAFMSVGVPCPKFKKVCSIEDIDEIDLSYPLIVKPTDRSGSLGVTKVTSYQELLEAIKAAISVSFKGEAIIEEYIEGREISVEFISYHGSHYPLTITDKVTTGAPHFVELEHHQPANLSQDMYDSIYSITYNALDSLGVTNGASHSEYRITNDGHIFIMEIGARMGGDFIGSDLVRLSTGYDFLKGVIDVALDKFSLPIMDKHLFSGVFFLCKETSDLLPILEAAGSYKEIRKAEITDMHLKSVTCSGDRSGYMIYQSEEKWNPRR
jgi:biotin carboxylase